MQMFYRKRIALITFTMTGRSKSNGEVLYAVIYNRCAGLTGRVTRLGESLLG
jgi:hypothetical protein